MNIQSLNYASKYLYPNGLLVTQGSLDRNQMEAIKGLRSIIRLSMQYLEVILKHGHMRGIPDRDTFIQDSDPYLESLMSMVRQGTMKEY